MSICRDVHVPCLSCVSLSPSSHKVINGVLVDMLKLIPIKGVSVLQRGERLVAAVGLAGYATPTKEPVSLQRGFIALSDFVSQVALYKHVHSQSLHPDITFWDNSEIILHVFCSGSSEIF